MVNIHELLERMKADPFMMIPHYEVTELCRECARYRAEQPMGYLVQSPNLLQPHFVQDETSARRLAGLAGVNVTIIEVMPRRIVLANVIDEKAILTDDQL